MAMSIDSTDAKVEDKTDSKGRYDIKSFTRNPPDETVPGGADPFTYWSGLSDAELDRVVLPRRPNRSRAADIYEQWADMLDGAETLTGFSFAGAEPPGSVVPIGAPRRIESSRNWSGARVAPTGGRLFDSVIGRWQAPNPRPVPLEHGLRGACSIWVGLGGHRRWSNALPQIGTVHVAGSGAAPPDFHTAWIQWWVRGADPTESRVKPRALSAPAITAGSVVLCWIEMVRPMEARFFLRKQGDPILYRAVVAMDGAPGPVPNAAVRGSAAEWIVERPRNPASAHFHPLARFRSVRFNRCAARTSAGQERLGACRMIRMVQQQQAPERATVISTPRRRSEDAGKLLITYTG
jgi:hypothetical protein